MKCPVCFGSSTALGEKSGYTYSRCDSCGLLFTQGVKPEHVRSQNLDPGPRHTETVENARLDALKGMHLQLNVVPRPLETILDFGSGFGETAAFLRRKGYRVLEIDLDTYLQLRDLRDNYIDGIMLIDVIEHLDDPVTVFKEFARVLRWTGAIVVEVDLSEEKGLDWYLLDPTVHHVTMHTKDSLALLAAVCNLRCTRLTDRMFLFEPLNEAENQGGNEQ